ncbi:hypothetical protein FACS189430_06750 [Bacteroidia bacterium]|nr:hypothetical protein FACS189430_06750 [Bacteroidia bacterium]
MQKEFVSYYNISNKELLYYSIKLVTSIFIYALFLILLYLLFTLRSDTVGENATIREIGMWLLAIILIVPLLHVIRTGWFTGMIKSNSVKISDKQMPEIYSIITDLSRRLQLKHIPDVYLLEAGGSLNAFATKFMGHNYVVIFSDLLEAFYDNDNDAVEFVIAHELGHIKRNHLLKRLLLAPSIIIPFLSSAYNRGCEITCDNIGNYFNHKGAVNGLKMLAGGKALHRKINTEEYMAQAYKDAGFWRWLVEIMSSHPSLYHRLNNVSRQNSSANQAPFNKAELQSTIPEVENEAIKEDYERFMPK